MNMFIHHVGREGANRDFPRTILNPVGVKRLNPYGKIFENQLRDISDHTYVWGVPRGAASYFKSVRQGDWIILIEALNQMPDQTYEGDIRFAFEIADYTTGDETDLAYALSKELWGESKFPLVVVGQVVAVRLLYSRLLRYLGYKPGFYLRGTFVRVKETEQIGSTSQLMERILTDSIVPEMAPAHTRQTAMVERVVRSATFQRRVLELFDYRCAVCGFSSQSDPTLINGVEAAHVIPVSKAGSDAVDNGIALCVLHHWAFDNGLMSFEFDDIHQTLTTVIHSTRAWGVEQRQWALDQFAGAAIHLTNHDDKLLRGLKGNLSAHNKQYFSP